MTKKVNALKNMFGLGLPKIVVQASLFLMVLLTSSTSFALFCGGHHDTDIWVALSAHSQGEADHQYISDWEHHETDDTECQLIEKSNEVVFMSIGKVSKIPSTIHTYPIYSFNPTSDRFDKKKIVRIRDYISNCMPLQLRGTVILNP